MYQFMRYAWGMGHSWTLHRNYLLPISPNIGQDEKDTAMAGVENTNTPTPVPPVDSEPADAGLSGMVTSSTAGSTPQGSPDQPASLRHCTWTTWNWLLWRYWNFSLLVATSPSSIWDALVGLCICLHITSSLYTVFWGSTVWIHSTLSNTCLQSTNHLGIEGNSFNVVSVVDFWMGGLSGPSATAPPEKIPKRMTPIETLGVCSTSTQKARWQT